MHNTKKESERNHRLNGANMVEGRRLWWGITSVEFERGEATCPHLEKPQPLGTYPVLHFYPAKLHRPRSSLPTLPTTPQGIWEHWSVGYAYTWRRIWVPSWGTLVFRFQPPEAHPIPNPDLLKPQNSRKASPHHQTPPTESATTRTLALHTPGGASDPISIHQRHRPRATTKGTGHTSTNWKKRDPPEAQASPAPTGRRDGKIAV